MIAFARYLPITPALPVTSETCPLPLDYSTPPAQLRWGVGSTTAPWPGCSSPWATPRARARPTSPTPTTPSASDPGQASAASASPPPPPAPSSWTATSGTRWAVIGGQRVTWPLVGACAERGHGLGVSQLRGELQQRPRVGAGQLDPARQHHRQDGGRLLLRRPGKHHHRPHLR